MAKEKTPKKEPRKRFTSNQVLILVTVMIASFLGRLDGTIVNLALPKIITDFGITVSEASWISTAYIIANAIFVPVFGKLGDMIGRKPLYLFGIIGFTITSALAGLSFNLPSLVVLRVLQAIAISIDYPIALSIIAYTFQDKGQRALAMGLWSGIFAASSVFGPLLGGPLIDAFSWRSVFYINIPLGILATWMASAFIHENVHDIKGLKNFDVWGSVFLGVALGAMVLVLDQGQTWGWGSEKSIISYFAIVMSFIAFIIIERREKEPIIDFKFFKIPAFTAALVTSFISFMGLFGGLFLIPIFAQNTLGYSTTKAGYLFMPMSFAIVLAAPIGARLSQRFPPRYITAIGMVIASAMLYFLMAGIDVKWTFWDFAWRLMVFAFGLGLGLAPLTNAATSTVPLHEVGVASSLLALVRNIAGAFGVAIFATILSNSTTHQLLQIEKYSVVTSLDPTVIQQAMALMATKANVGAYSIVFHVSGVLLLLGAFAALFIKEAKRDPKLAKAAESHPVEV
jgi:EmrB/QacA subfamily drug resistance transporter